MVAHTCFLVVCVSDCVSPSARLGYMATYVGKMHLIYLSVLSMKIKHQIGEVLFKDL